MATQAGFIIEGDDEDNELRAKWVRSHSDIQIYNVIYGHGGNDSLVGNDGMFDTRIEKAGVQLFGEDGNDDLRGTGSADTLDGGVDDDTITYDGGNDLIDGGEGEDTLTIFSPYVDVNFDKVKPTGIENIDAGGASIKFGAWNVHSFDKISGGGKLVFSLKTIFDGSNLVGAFDFYGSNFNDEFDLSKVKWAFDAHGNGGNDVIAAGSAPVRLWGDEGNDILRGSAGYDQLRGGGGNDKLIGEGDSGDTLDGGNGDDELIAGDGKDSISAGDGNDLVNTGDGTDSIFVGTGNDIVHAGDGDDVISGARLLHGDTGAKAADFKILDGGGGDDTFADFEFDARSKSHILGGVGEDSVTLGGDVSHLVVKDVEILSLSESRIIADADLLDSFEQIVDIKDRQISIQFSSGGAFTWKPDWEKQNNATLVGSKDADHIDMTAAAQLWTINGGGGNDTIIGPSDSNFVELLDGGDGNDTLTGGRFSDNLYGGDGKDILIASKGNDGLYGGSSQDTFVFSDGIGTSTIVNYDNSGKDRDIIDLSDVGSIKNFDDMIDHHIKMKFEGHWLMIQLDKGEIYLYGVKASDLDESAFIF